MKNRQLMRADRAIATLSLLLLAATSAACRTPSTEIEPIPAEPLTVAIALDLQKQIAAKYAKPAGWLDAARYVAIDAIDGDPASAKRFVIVDAATGKKTLLYDRAVFERALAALPSVTPANAKAWSERTDVGLAPDSDALLLVADSDLFAWRFDSDRAVRLAQDSIEEEVSGFSPDGRRVAFVKGGNLHVTSVEEGATQTLTTDGGPERLCGKLDWLYQEEVYGRGNFRGWFFSPDSSKIACLVLDEHGVPAYTIVDTRKRRPDVEVLPYPKPGDANPKASLAIFDLATGERTDADLSAYVDQDTLLVRVHWTPDSGRVLLQVQDRIQTWLDLLAIDPATGKATQLFREKTPAWTEPTDAPFFLADGKRFLWLSERSGFRHLWLYDQDGRELGALTEGAFEVDSVHAVTNGDEAILTVDLDDVKGQQLFRLDIASKQLTRLTSMPGTHLVSVPKDGGCFVDEWSALAEPGDVTLRDRDGAALRTIATADTAPIEKHGIVAPEFLKLPTRDGGEIEGYWIAPQGFEPGKRYPVFCFTYAGPHAPQALDRYLNRDVFWFHYLAQQGYLVCVLDPRASSGRGLTSAAPVWKSLGVRELADLEDGIDALVAKGVADPARVALFGWSYGGYITAFALTHSKKFKVGIAGAPVTDWTLYDSIYTERLMDLPSRNPAGYAAGSVLRAAKDLSGELLLIHGEIDENVHAQNTLQLAEALQRAGKQFSLMIYPGNRHSVVDPAQKLHLYETMTRFIQERL